MVDEIRPEVELFFANLAAKDATIQPVNLFGFKGTHQLLLVVIQGNLVALSDMLIQGEVVTKDAERKKRFNILIKI